MDSRRHFHRVPLLFRLLGCQIRPISQTSQAPRKRGQYILLLEIFPPPGATALHQWQFCLSNYVQYPQNYQSPPRQVNTRDKSMPTLYEMFTNSSYHLYKTWHVMVYQLIVPMGRFRGVSQSLQGRLRTTCKMSLCTE